jgi:hypothetical protein
MGGVNTDASLPMHSLCSDYAAAFTWAFAPKTSDDSVRRSGILVPNIRPPPEKAINPIQAL